MTFTFASSCKRTGIEKNVVIMEESLQQEGDFVLVYFGFRNCVLGMSKPFHIRYVQGMRFQALVVQ